MPYSGFASSTHQRPDKPLIVKCTFDRSMRRITFSSAQNCSFDLLRTRVEQCFSLYASSFVVKYKDDDGEVTDITCEDDLTEAIQYFNLGDNSGGPVPSAGASAYSGRSSSSSGGTRKITLRVDVGVDYNGPSLSETTSLSSSEGYKEKRAAMGGSDIDLEGSLSSGMGGSRSAGDDQALRNFGREIGEVDEDAMTISSRPTTVATVTKQRMALSETRVQMAEIPPKIIAQAKVFHAHLQYVLTHNTQERPPPGLQRALDELMDEEEMNEDLRKEVLQDGEARRILFMMSFERTLKRMVENAERVSKLIEERDSLEEGLGWGIDRDDDEILGADEGEGDDAYPKSPEDMRHGESPFDVLASKSLGIYSSQARDPSRKKKGTAMAHWLKLRVKIILTAISRRSKTNSNNRPYPPASGSQSEPHLATTGEEEEGDNVTNCGDGSKGKSGGGSGSGSMTPGMRPHRPTRQPSKLSVVQFADNPYGDRHPTGEEEDAVDNVVEQEI